MRTETLNFYTIKISYSGMHLEVFPIFIILYNSFLMSNNVRKRTILYFHRYVKLLLFFLYSVAVLVHLFLIVLLPENLRAHLQLSV